MQDDENKGKNRFIAGVCALVLNYIFLGLSFVPVKYLGIYSLISSLLFAIAACAFITPRKKEKPNAGKKAAAIFAYIGLLLSAAVFAGGLIYSIV